MLSTKRIIAPGKFPSTNVDQNAQSYEDGTKVVFHYSVQRFKHDPQTGEREIVETVDDSRLPYPNGYGQPMEIIYGKKFKLPSWEQCLESMCPEEIAEFVMEPREMIDYPFVSKQLRDFSKQKNRFHQNARSGHEQIHDHEDGGGTCAFSCMGMMAQKGLGYQVLDNLIAKPEPLLFTFHLLQILRPDEYERESWALTAEQKQESIPKLKHDGNELFRQGRFEEAEQKYMEAITRLDVLVLREKPGEPEWKVFDDQKVPFYLNLAQIKLIQKEFYKAIEAATEVLRREKENSKALYRRGKAYAGAWQFDDARSDFEHLRQIDPSCVGMIEKELTAITDMEKKGKNDEVAQYRNIFN